MIELNKIYFEECLNGMDKIPTGFVDMIFCDLPYGETQAEFDKIIPFVPLWAQYLRVTKLTSPIILTGSLRFAAKLIASNEKMFRYEWVWNKKIVTGFLNAKKQPLRQHEFALVFYRKQSLYQPQMHSNKLPRNFEGHLQKNPNSINYGQQKQYVSTITEDISYPRSVLDITGVVNNSREKLSHPQQKPVALVKYFLETYSKEGDIVLDNCVGSGTTAEACILTNRNYIAFENNPKNFSIAENRAKNAKLQKDIALNLRPQISFGLDY